MQKPITINKMSTPAEQIRARLAELQQLHARAKDTSQPGDEWIMSLIALRDAVPKLLRSILTLLPLAEVLAASNKDGEIVELAQAALPTMAEELK